MTITLTREEAQQVLDALVLAQWVSDKLQNQVVFFEAEETLRARLSAPEPEPPRFPTMLRKMWSGSEVQAWIDEHYTPPPQSEWQSLTDDEIEQVRIQTFAGFQDALNETRSAKRDPATLCRAIEAKLKEKNT